MRDSGLTDTRLFCHLAETSEQQVTRGRGTGGRSRSRGVGGLGAGGRARAVRPQRRPAGGARSGAAPLAQRRRRGRGGAGRPDHLSGSGRGGRARRRRRCFLPADPGEPPRAGELRGSLRRGESAGAAAAAPAPPVAAGWRSSTSARRPCWASCRSTAGGCATPSW